jgi:hypothetical protein
MISVTHLIAPSSFPFRKSVCLDIKKKNRPGEVSSKATTHPSPIAHRHFRTCANIYHINSDGSSALIMDSCDLNLHGLACVAAMEARAATQQTNTINDPYVATPNQTQSTTGFETTEAKDHKDLIERNQTTTSTNSEIPHPTISAITVLMNDLSLASQDELPTMPVMYADNESDDGWSVVSDESDFVVIDTAETAHKSSNDEIQEELEGGQSKSETESDTTMVREQIVLTCQDEEKEPATMSAVHDSRSGQVKHRQQCAGIKGPDNIIDALIERHAERVRAWSKALASEVSKW